MATNEDPSIPSSDDIYIRIVTHQLPGPVDKRDALCEYAIRNTWEGAKSIYDEFPDMIGIPLTDGGDTALHVAVRVYSVSFVKELVDVMKPEYLEIRNSDRNTAFCDAAKSGQSDLLKIMSSKNNRLPQIRGHDGMLPVHLAALFGRHWIVQDLSPEDHLELMGSEDIKRLFFMTIHSAMYDVAIKLLERYRDLATSRDEENLTAFHLLARKSPFELIKKGDEEEEASPGGHTLLTKLWSHVRQRENKMDLIATPSPAFFDALKSGNDIFVKLLLSRNPACLTQRDSDGLTLLHFAALHRRHSILKYILDEMGTDWTVTQILRAVDKDHNNVLHFAAQQPANLEGRSGSSSLLLQRIQMQKELAWYKELAEKVPLELRTMKNSKGMQPIDIFYHTRTEDVKVAATGALNSGMVVAVLVASVAFAAAFTVPDDKTNAWFDVFLLSNAFAFFSSCASIISFLSIFTSSRFRATEFIFLSLHPSLILGLVLLLCSIASMVIAFAAASVMIFGHVSKGVAYVAASMASIPLIVFFKLHVGLPAGGLIVFLKLHVGLPAEVLIDSFLEKFSGLVCRPGLCNPEANQ